MNAEQMREAWIHFHDQSQQYLDKRKELTEFLRGGIAALRTHRTDYRGDDVTIRDGSVYSFNTSHELSLSEIVEHKQDIMDGVQHPNKIWETIEMIKPVVEKVPVGYSHITAESIHPSLSKDVMAVFDPHITISKHRVLYIERDDTIKQDPMRNTEYGFLDADHKTINTDGRIQSSNLGPDPTLFRGIQWYHAHLHRATQQMHAIKQDLSDGVLKKYAVLL